MSALRDFGLRLASLRLDSTSPSCSGALQLVLSEAEGRGSASCMKNNH